MKLGHQFSEAGLLSNLGKNNCMDHVLALKMMTEKSTEKGGEFFAVLMDQRKACDRVARKG